MVKKFIFMAFAASQITFVSANVHYPAVLNNGQPFTDINQFENIYQKIHDDILVVDQPLIIKRTCQHESIDCQYLPEENQTELTRFNQYFRNQASGRSQWENLSKTINATLQFEINMARQEKTWARSSQLPLIFEDTDFGGKNSPFDIMTDSLEGLEKIFIGNKTKKFQPQFVVQTESESFITDAELWQDQQKNAAIDNPDFAETETDSIGGSHAITGNYIVKNVAPHSLVANRVAKNLWDSWFSTTAIGSSQCAGLNISVDTPFKPVDTPMIYLEMDKKILAELQAEIQAFVQQTECVLNEDTDNQTKATLQEKQQSLSQCDQQRQVKLQQALINFDKNQKNFALDQEYKTIDTILQYLDSFYKTIQDQHAKKTELFECYLQHTSK